jgi:membrane protein
MWKEKGTSIARADAAGGLHVMQIKKMWPLSKQAAKEWSDDNASRLAAALAYYTALSLAPLLVLSVSVLGLFTQRARDFVIDQMQQLMGSAGKDAATQIINSAKHGSGVIATIISIIVLLFGAAGVFGNLQDAMNTIWEVKPKPLGFWGTIRNRFLSLAMVMGVCFLLLVSLAVSTGVSAFTRHLSGGAAFIGHVADLVISIGVVACLFAAIFKFLPDIKMPWRFVWLGALLTSIMFTIGKILLGLYFTYASPASAYGAAGSLAAMLVWVYYSAQILFFGAEFTQVYAYSHGFKPKLQTTAEPMADRMRAQQGLEPKSRPQPPRIVTVTQPESMEARRGAMIAGVGLAAGFAVGAAGMLSSRWDKRVQTLAINDRLDRVEARIAHRKASHVGRELNVIDRLNHVEAKIREAADAARRKYDPRPAWVRRFSDWAHSL